MHMCDFQLEKINSGNNFFQIQLYFNFNPFTFKPIQVAFPSLESSRAE